MSPPTVIAVSGLSGSGKSTLLRSVAAHCGCRHVTASNVIKQQLQYESGLSTTSEALRAGSIEENQRLLVKGFARLTQPSDRPILFDCHTVIDTPDGVETVPLETFRALPLTMFTVLVVDPADILERRSVDRSRSRPARSEEELRAQQKQALAAAKSIAEVMDIPFNCLREGGTPTPSEALHEILSGES